ncbi:MAG: nitroreductase family protein [Euzebya sp.]
MDFYEVVRHRRMVRAYHPDPVPPEVIRRILDTATRAPSAGFSQPHRFVVITAAQARRRIADACGEPAAVARGLDPWLSVAPVHIIPCVELSAYDRRYAEKDKARSDAPGTWAVPFQWVDAGAAFMLLLLAAVAEGLTAGFLAVDHDALRAATTVPTDWTPVGLITLGRGLDVGPTGSAARPRLPLESVIHWA